MGLTKKVDHYAVKLEYILPSIGKELPYTICRFYTEEEALAFAREKQANFRVTVLVLETIVGW